MKMTLKRLFSLMLVMCLLLSNLPVGAFAEELAVETEPTIQVEQPAQQEETELLTDEQEPQLQNEETPPAAEDPVIEEPAAEEGAEEEITEEVTPSEEVIPSEETVTEDTAPVEGESQETTEEEPVISEEIQTEEDVSDKAADGQVSEETQTNAVDALFERLMGAATYEELDAMMEAMSEEEYALMNQFSDEQNAALTARIEELSSNEIIELDAVTLRQGDTATYTQSVERDDYSFQILKDGSIVSENASGIDVSNIGNHTIQVETSENTPVGEYIIRFGYNTFWWGFSEAGTIQLTVEEKIEADAPVVDQKKMTFDKTVTANANGNYDLKLTVSGAVGSKTNPAKVDIVLVIDRSGSMEGNRLTNAKSAAKTLINALNTNENIDARYNIVTFSGSSSATENREYVGHTVAYGTATSGWTGSASSASSYVNGISANGATNYEAGLLQAQTQLQSARSGATTIVVFLTDGLPTLRVSTYYRGEGQGYGTGNENNSASVERCLQDAINAVAKIAMNRFYVIGTGTANAANLTRLANGATLANEKTVKYTSDSNLNQTFSDIASEIAMFLCENVTITDTLNHVGGTTAQDRMVEVTNAESVKVTVYKGDTIIAGPAAEVNLEATDMNGTATLTASYNENTGVLKLDFPDEYQLEADYTYVLSAEIAPTEKAYEEYRKGGYTEAGESNTGTHSGQFGFYSNDSAIVTYTYQNTESQDDYAHPVVQLHPGKLVINKTVEGLDAASLSQLTFDVALTYPGKAAETKSISFAQFTPNEDGTYTFVMNGLSPNTKYTVTESGYEVADYEVETTVTGGDSREGITASGTVAKGETHTVNFVNTYTLAKVDVSGSKTWDDNDNQDGKRPASITIRLLADGEEVASKVVTEADGWTWTFEGQEKFNENGKLITYTVAEDSVEGYVATYNGTNVTNTHTPEIITVSGSKTWNDNNNQDGARPASITIHLLANGEEVASKTVTAEDNWAWAFEGLEKYAEGEEIVYTVIEDDVPGYSAVVNGTNVTNTHKIEKTSISGIKTWDDADNQDGIRPSSITINLLADGEKVDSKVVTAADGWAWTFANLDKYKAGQVIAYTIAEEPVEGYTSVVNGTNVTNTHVPSRITISGAKTWDDAENQDGIRPATITVVLKADGEPVHTRTVSAENGWAWTFANLAEYAAGQKIQYTISELTVDGYSSKIEGFNVTNTHVPAVTSINVTKTWDDKDNQDGKRPNSVTIELFADGVKTDNTLTLSEGNNWTGSFENLPVNKAGTAIVYTIAEQKVPEYQTTIAMGDNGYTVTNRHVPEVVTVSGAKTWDDNNNQDGARPAAITINLLANGEVIETIEVTAEDNWAWSFSDLPKYENGTMIKYSISEEAVRDYSTSYDGNNVTNTHTPAQTSVTVSKSWDDNNDQDGIRPKDITVVLEANGTATDKTLVLNDGNNWTGSFTKLDKFANGQIIRYTVKEIAVEGYATVITGDQNSGYTITNTHTPETVEVSGAKTWEDNFNQDGKRPGAITINLMKDGQVLVSKEVTAADDWKWTFTNLPKYENHGTQIVYSITEAEVDNYTTTYNGYNVTNTHAPEKTSVSVVKSWRDSNDQDGIRPNDITVKLLANGADTDKTLVLNEGNSWTGSFTELDKFADGQEIVYTIEEIEVAGYESVITGGQAAGFIITNTHNPETVEVSGAKTWVDNNDQDGFRPDSITINLLKNGEVIDTKTVTAADGWTWSFPNLPKYENHGTLINYSVTENAVDDYTSVINGYNVTNTHAPEKTSVTVTKAWQDNNDQDGIRPNDITVKLLANDTDSGKTLVLNQGNSWTGSFADLDKYANGEVIKYTVAEVAVTGYNSVITGNQDNGYIITNSHTPAVVAVSGSKTWDDNNNQDGFRPASITINLLKNGTVLDTKVVTEADGWAWSFPNLPKYENHGILINYSIEETVVDQYTTVYDGYDVTNTHAPEKTSVTVTKAWQDNNDQDGKRPNDITVKLLGNGEDTGKTLVLNDTNNWTGSFTDLDKYANGAVIAYTVQEIKVEGYNSVVTGTQAEGYTITNSHTPAVVAVAGAKTWDDKYNQDGMRPESITIKLLADGVEIDTKTVTEADGWAWSFTNLPEFKNHGTKIIYTISEVAVDEYTATIDGFNVTNKHTPEETSVTVTKSWQDNDNQDGIRPEKITVNLLADGKKVDSQKITAEDNWTYTFTELDVYAKGVKIVYTVEEEAVEGYETVITGDQKEGFIITNSHTPAVVEVAGAKTWDDANDQDGKRPDAITVNLLANGKVIETVEVTAEAGWAWSFTNLPKFEAGVEIIYTITEDAVEDYTTTYDGYNITNKYTPQKTSITVTKRWVDGQNHDGIRPNSVKVVLYANGKKVDSMRLSEKHKWTGVFEDLPVYQNGERIKYTLQEKSVSGYNATITGNARKGFIVTNTHNIIPKTGDESNLPLYTGLFAGSMSVMAVLMYLAKPKKGKYAR